MGPDQPLGWQLDEALNAVARAATGTPGVERRIERLAQDWPELAGAVAALLHSQRLPVPRRWLSLEAVDRPPHLVGQMPGEPQGPLGKDQVLVPVPDEELERDYASGVVPRPPTLTEADRRRIAADVAAAKRDAGFVD